MTPLSRKLNLKPEHEVMVVLHAPASFEAELQALAAAGVLVARTTGPGLGFGLAFAVTQAELNAAIAQLTAAAVGDAVLWFAYPKQSSKRYRCEFHRDSGWDALAAAGYDSVRMVAIDEDWSALRFRKVEHMGKPAPRAA
jgi:hypothetical protein